MWIVPFIIKYSVLLRIIKRVKLDLIHEKRFRIHPDSLNVKVLNWILIGYDVDRDQNIRLSPFCVLCPDSKCFGFKVLRMFSSP